VFTPAHASAGAAIKEFFGSHPAPKQPFDFSHKIHLSKGVLCTDCHTGVEQGAVAGLPSINTCMICHSQIATDRPLIQQLTKLSDAKTDLQPEVYPASGQVSAAGLDDCGHKTCSRAGMLILT